MTRSGRTTICLFISRFLSGGTERQMLALARELDPDRYRLVIACFRNQGPWQARAAAAAEAVVEFPLKGFAHPTTLLQLFRFARWCRQERVQVVQTADFYGNIFGLPGAALGGVPVRVASRRGLGDVRTSRQLWLQRFAYSFAHRIVANSQAAAGRLRGERIEERRIVVIPNGVEDTLPPAESRDRLRVVLTVARLRTEKTVDVAIEAMARLPAELTDAELWIAGDGPERPRLEALVRARQLAGRVTFLGDREDVPQLLRQADAFVLASRTEASPNALLEAMAAGLPCIATNVGGVPELIEDGVNGILVPPNDPESLARALAGLLASPARAAGLARAARAAAGGRSFEQMARRFEAVYEGELVRLAPQRLSPVSRMPL